MSRQVGSKRRYSSDVLAEASSLVQSGALTLCAASNVYNIPKTTLHDTVKGKYASNRKGAGTVLTHKEERRLADWVVSMARIGYGRTKQELLAFVKKIIGPDGRKTPFTDNKPGKDWYYGFTKRHPEISPRSPSQLEKERSVVTPNQIRKWYSDLRDFLENEVKEPGLINDPSRIYNADESGFPMCPKSDKVLAMRGSKVVYNVTSSNKSQITVLACMSAIGHFITPMIVYPGQRFSPNILDGFEESAIGRSDNGWMDAEFFSTWLTSVLILDLNSSGVTRPILLFVDGHTTHITLEASDICTENSVHMYCLPAHASHLMQPMDIRLFSPFKDNWSQAVRDFQIANIPEIVSKKKFAKIFKGPWQKSTTVENATVAKYLQSPTTMYASTAWIPSQTACQRTNGITQCIVCRGWAHDKCAPDIMSFICPNCDSEDDGEFYL